MNLNANQQRGNKTDRGNFGQSNRTSNWLVDKSFEETSIEYLKNSSIFKEMKVEEIIKDRERQLRGIDVISEIYKNVDVKSIASKLPTFCFEISGNIHSGQVGWFCNDDLDTDFYLVVWHEVQGAKSYQSGKRLMNLENVVSTEALLIRKSDLKKAVEEELGDLKELVEKIRSYNIHQKTSVKFDSNANPTKAKMDIYPVLSAGLYEQPINVVVRKEVLEKLSIKHWIIKDKKE